MNEDGEADGRGRPPIEINLERLRDLCKIHCTFDELACIFECSVRTIERRYADDEEFKSIVDAGRAEGRESLRRQLYKVALLSDLPFKEAPPNAVTALIWLTKQPESRGGLGFSDKIEHHHTGKIETWSDLLRGGAAAEKSDAEAEDETPEPIH